MIAYEHTDNLLRFSAGRTVDLATGEAIWLDANALVAVTLVDQDGLPVAGEVWPLVLSYVAGSPGAFLGVLRDTLALTAVQDYTLIATVNAGVDQARTWRLPLRVVVGTG